MNWDRNILTDSGGYQVYSSLLKKKKGRRLKFKSHIDGSTENVMEIQRTIGADIIMAFDECTPYPCDYRYAQRSMKMTHRWLDRCVSHLEKPVKRVRPFSYCTRKLLQRLTPAISGIYS
jgi:queuine tRNA-ribosyltransferase